MILDKTNGDSLTVNIVRNDARPASDVSSPSACIIYPKLTQNPNSSPALRVLASCLACSTNGINGNEATMNRTTVKSTGSMIASTSFTTGMLLAETTRCILNKLTFNCYKLQVSEEIIDVNLHTSAVRQINSLTDKIQKHTDKDTIQVLIQHFFPPFPRCMKLKESLRQ